MSILPNYICRVSSLVKNRYSVKNSFLRLIIFNYSFSNKKLFVRFGILQSLSHSFIPFEYDERTHWRCQFAVLFYLQHVYLFVQFINLRVVHVVYCSSSLFQQVKQLVVFISKLNVYYFDFIWTTLLPKHRFCSFSHLWNSFPHCISPTAVSAFVCLFLLTEVLAKDFFYFALQVGLEVHGWRNRWHSIFCMLNNMWLVLVVQEISIVIFRDI